MGQKHTLTCFFPIPHVLAMLCVCACVQDFSQCGANMWHCGECMVWLQSSHSLVHACSPSPIISQRWVDKECSPFQLPHFISLTLLCVPIAANFNLLLCIIYCAMRSRSDSPQKWIGFIHSKKKGVLLNKLTLTSLSTGVRPKLCSRYVCGRMK